MRWYEAIGAVMTTGGAVLSGRWFAVWLKHRRDSQVNYETISRELYKDLSVEQDRMYKRLQDQLTALNIELGRLHGENAALNKQVDKLQAQVATLQNLNRTLKNENARLEERIQELERELKQYQEKHGE